MRLGDCWVVSVVPVQDIDVSGWSSGPLPVNSGPAVEPGWRTRHLREPVRRILTSDEVRWHRKLHAEDQIEVDGLTIIAVEAIVLGEVKLALFHWASSATDALSLVSHVRRLGGTLTAANGVVVWRAMERAFGKEGCLGSDEIYRANTIAIAVALEEGGQGEQELVVGQLAAGSSGNDDSSHADDLVDGVFRIPGRLVRVHRRGAAFLTVDGNRARYTSSSRANGVDVVALSVLQREELDRIVGRLGALEDPVEARLGLPEVERMFRAYQHALWWQEISAMPWPNRLLRACHGEFGMVGEMQLIREEINDLAQLAATENGQITNSLLGIVAILSFPAVAGTIAPAVGANSIQSGVSAGVLLLVGVGLGVSPLGRPLRMPLVYVWRRRLGRGG